MWKKAIIKVVNDLPNDVQPDEVIEKLIVLEKIESGFKDVKAGRLICHDFVIKKARKWSQ